MVDKSETSRSPSNRRRMFKFQIEHKLRQIQAYILMPNYIIKVSLVSHKIKNCSFISNKTIFGIKTYLKTYLCKNKKFSYKIINKRIDSLLSVNNFYCFLAEN